MFFYCNFSTKTLANCNKASIKKSSAHHRNCSPLNRPTPDIHTYSNLTDGSPEISGGLLQAPLNPLKTGVSWGPPGLSGGPGPLGPNRNSTTAHSGALQADRHVVETSMILAGIK